MVDSQQAQDSAAEPMCESATAPSLLSRRNFLFGASASVVLLTVPAWMRGPRLASRIQAQIATFPRQRIGARLPSG